MEGMEGVETWHCLTSIDSRASLSCRNGWKPWPAFLTRDSVLFFLRVWRLSDKTQIAVTQCKSQNALLS